MASVRLDIVPISHCDTNTYLAFSAQITVTQRLLLTLAMVTFFLLMGVRSLLMRSAPQTPVNIVFQRRTLLSMTRENYKV